MITELSYSNTVELMKIFAINLKREPVKLAHIIQECEKYDLDIDIITAIDGKELPSDYLINNIYDYPNCELTLGEIGCALSHINLYKKIVEQKLPYAMIIEDDAQLNDKLPIFITEFEKSNTKKGIFLLTGDFCYIKNHKFKLGDFDLYPVVTALRTTGYIITLDAAKKLIKFLMPIRYEADMFEIFRICTGIKVYATIPHIISTNDKNKNNSSLEVERLSLMKNRLDYRKNFFKYKENRRKLSNFFWRIFLRPKEKRQHYHDY